MDSAPLCDRYLTESWYRAKNYVMATSAPSLAHCGTLYPVWLSGTVPPRGLTSIMTACEVGFSDICQRSYRIDVKNCTDFLVYKLKAVDVCNSAYCFDLHDGCIHETVRNVKVSFHNITWKRHQHPQVPGLVRYDPSVNLLCSFTPSNDDTLLYHIDWYVDNKTVIQGQTVHKKSLQNAILSAEDLNKAGKKINSWIHCVVGVKRTQDNQPCFTTSSNVFFAGIEILNHTLTIKRKGKATLMIRPTIPFASETIEVNNIQSTSSLNIQLSFPDNNAKCQAQSRGSLKKCSVAIESYTYNSRQAYVDPTNWNKVYNIEVFSTDDEIYYLRGHKLVLRLETSSASGQGAKIFANAAFHDVHINIVDNQGDWKGKRCRSHGDPYVTTFDGYWYPCQQTGCVAGKTYLLYKNEDHLQEVQIRHENCWEGSCLCAVAVRAGQDVFIIDFCRGRQLINFLSCKEDSLKVIKQTDTVLKITFPTGTFVTASIKRSSRGPFRIFTDVYPSVADVRRTSGLCGYLDSNKNNDLRRRDGTQDKIRSGTFWRSWRSNPPDRFSLSWQLRKRDNDDLLSYAPDVYDHLQRLSSQFHKLCTCDEEQTRCSYRQYSECKTKVKGKEYHCSLHSSRRKRRDLQYLTEFRSEEWRHTKLRRFKRQTITEDEALDLCNKVYQQTVFYKTCLQAVPNFSNESLVNCMSDLILSGNRELIKWHLNSALGECQTYTYLNSSFQDENSRVATTLTNLCQNDCNNRGTCSKGTCRCRHGYGGSDCSFDVLSPPTITRLSDNGICDKSQESCDDITLYGQYFLESMGTTCYVTREEISNSNIVKSTASYRVGLEERTLYEGYCSLQYGSDQSWITKFHFNLSTDATQQHSKTHTVHIYQSQCQTFHNDSKGVYFTLQRGYCYINGRCVQDGTAKSNDSLWKCKPEINAYDWTLDDQEPCVEGNALEIDKLGNLTKRSPSYEMDSFPLCDRYITETWYIARNHVMPTSPPRLTRCGTLYPVWLSEPIPANGVKKTLTACEVGFSGNCSRSYKIDVKNCSKYLAYKLKALDVCSSAYCFEAKRQSPA